MLAQLINSNTLHCALLCRLSSRLESALLAQCRGPVEEEAVQRSSKTDSTQEHFKKDLDVEKAFITEWSAESALQIYVVENTERNEKSNESLLAD